MQASIVLSCFALVAMCAVVQGGIHCSFLNIHNWGCFCGNETKLCPHSKCSLYCMSRVHCDSPAIFCDYPYLCATDYQACVCIPAGIDYDGSRGCCSGALPEGDKCVHISTCIKDVQCLRYDQDTEALYCDKCVTGRCVKSDVPNCGMNGGQVKQFWEQAIALRSQNNTSA